jgi:glycogen operon protein
MQAEASAGFHEPLGATLDSTGANFAYPAPGAEAVFVCVFDDADREIARIRLPGRTGDVHHGHVAGMAAGTRYGLRVEGPFAPWHGHRFNPRKLLVDPWAGRIDRRFALNPALFDTGEAPDDPRHLRGPRPSRRHRPSARPRRDLRGGDAGGRLDR